MDEQRWQTIKKIFDEAIELAADKRVEFVKSAANGDDEIISKVNQLIVSDESGTQLGGIVQQAASEAVEATPVQPLPEQIGAYRIVKNLGHGGMGTVYLGERSDQQFEQQVAIKVVRLHSASSDIIERFRWERQILANLNHPNIAHLHDGGETEEGLPYLVMEYVEGLPIDQYCDEHRLSPAHRIELFLDVCHAVQHAHQNLVIHRDIKPTNILVTNQGIPKLLDFGIAKLARDDIENNPQLTVADMRVMTPENASPEQVRGKPLTTASDVYSLGILLYRLCTGVAPYELKGARPAEIESIICLSEPTRPSTVVKKIPENVDTDLSVLRNTTPEQLSRQLKGDLDNIVLKCLRKEPDARYESAGQLAEDIERYTNQLPVLAHPPSTWYATKKFLRRRRLPVAITAVAVAVATALTATYTHQLGVARDEAETEALKAQRISSFLVNMFASADPDATQGRNTTIGEVLDRGAEAIGQEKDIDPEIKAELFSVIGDTYLGLGDYSRSEEMLRENLRTLEENDGDELQIARAQSDLGTILRVKHDYTEAEPLFRAGLETQQRLLPQPSGELARALNNYAQMLTSAGRFDEAIPLLEEAIAQSSEANGVKHPETADFFNNIGVVYSNLGRLTEETQFYKKALDINRELLGNLHPDTLQGVANYGLALSKQGRYDEAMVYYEESLTGRQKVLGPHPLTSSSLELVGGLHRKLGNFEKAEEYLTAALDLIIEKVGNDHSNTARRLRNLGHLYFDTHQAEKAVEVYGKSLSIYQNLPSPSRQNLCRMQGLLGAALIDVNDLVRARENLNNANGCYREYFGSNDLGRDRTLLELGRLEFKEGNLGQAIAQYEASAKLTAAHVSDTSPRMVRSLFGLAQVLKHSNDVDSARIRAQQAYDILTASLPDTHYQAVEIRQFIQQL